MSGKRKELNYEERSEIYLLHRQGLSLRAIGKKVKRAHTTIKDTIDRFKKTGSHFNLRGRGNRSLLTEKDKQYLRLISKRDRKKTIPIIKEEFNLNRARPISATTIRKYFTSIKLNGRVAAKKPYLRKYNYRKRLEFAKKHVDWTNEQWSKVLFTDESQFMLFGNNRRTYVRRFSGERYSKNCLVPTIKHGTGSIMVWGGISAQGVTQLKRIKGKMDKKMYHSILIHQALPSGKRLIGKNFIFQQDNDPKHTAILCKNYLERKRDKGKYLIKLIKFT